MQLTDFMKNKEIIVGTSKGLVVSEKKENVWGVKKIHFLGLPVSTIYKNEFTGTWWTGISHRHWGQKLYFSDNEGQNWEMVSTPKYPKGAKIYPSKLATLKKIWCISHAGKDNPHGLWIGTEPGGLFYSDDSGTNFQLVDGLWNHPSRRNQNQWFGAGRDFPFIHSIVVDQRDSKHVFVAVSCAGIFETRDGGITWNPKNSGLIATYLPNPNVEVGHDPHLLLACKKKPDVLWQQNHCGIFRSVDAGDNWQNISDKNGIADYGFALAIDHENEDRAWVIPVVSDEVRVAHDLSLTVCRTEDAGQNWESLKNGLPQENSFDIVFRHCLAISKNELVFGTTTGNLFYSENAGDDWICLSNNLARVEGVIFG